MVKKIFFPFFLFSILTGCASSDVIVVAKDKPAISMEFGPLFLPEDNYFGKVSINYITPQPLPTRVYFSMVDNVDWLREKDGMRFSHKMLFSGLEEGTRYRFFYLYNGVKKEGSIISPPFGEEYCFSFSVMPFEKESKLNILPAFIIVVADRNVIELERFISFYKSNEKILKNSIIIPMFEIFSPNPNFYIDTLFLKTKFNYFHYKGVTIIIINDKIESYDEITSCIPDLEDNKTYMVIGNIGREEVRKIYHKFHSKVKKFFVPLASSIEAKDVLVLDRGFEIFVDKKERYALNLKEVEYE